jgi:hypothetical protein
MIKSQNSIERYGWHQTVSTKVMAAIDLGFNWSTQQIGQNVLPVFDSLVFF